MTSDKYGDTIYAGTRIFYPETGGDGAPAKDREAAGISKTDEEFIREWEALFGKDQSLRQLSSVGSSPAVAGRGENPAASEGAEEPQSEDGDIFTRDIGELKKQLAEGEEFWQRSARLRKERAAEREGAPAVPHKVIRRTLIALLAAALLYSLLVFSQIPFIAKWRTVYIETAMSTMTHQWLATAFIPGSVIDGVLEDRDSQAGAQNGLESDWSITPFSSRTLYQTWNIGQKKFAEVYSEIDQESFAAYLSEHEGEFINGDGWLVIDKAGLKDEGTGIETVYGDQVLAVDTYNAVTIVLIKGDGYVGRLAIVKDPSRVGVGLSEFFGEKGSQVGDLAAYNDAVLAINASGFYDPSGHGNGGTVFGLVVQDGQVLNGALADKTVGFVKNELNIGEIDSGFKFRDAVEFKPALIINGQKLVEGSAGWGVQPRSAIGQTKRGEVLLLIVDGRQPGYSLGCSVGELALIMERYGAYQAINLDGGSSAIMYYNGRVITRNSSGDKENGRFLPDGFVVKNRD